MNIANANLQLLDPRFSQPETLVFVVGTQKGGTTWLYKYLHAHPEVCMPDWKEHNFWNTVEGQTDSGSALMRLKARREKQWRLISVLRDMGFSDAARRRRGARRALAAAEAPMRPYRAYADSLFANFGPDHKAVGEVSPAYEELSAETYREMASLAPNVKFIFLMRDPVSRLISGVLHGLRATTKVTELTEGMLHDALLSELDQGLQGRTALRRSRYDLTIADLEAAVPASQIGYYFFESLFEQSEIDKLCDFIGIGHYDAELKKAQNVGSGKSVAIAPADRARIALMLAPAYVSLRQKFGDAIPPAWQKSEALLNGTAGGV